MIQSLTLVEVTSRNVKHVASFTMGYVVQNLVGADLEVMHVSQGVDQQILGEEHRKLREAVTLHMSDSSWLI
jgi:hypothetical protein